MGTASASISGGSGTGKTSGISNTSGTGRSGTGRRGRGHFALCAVAVCCLAACGAHRPLGPGAVEEGQASFYGRHHHGHLTASGQIFDMYALTAAHRTLRFGSRVEVLNLRNGRLVQVRINDRGPFQRGRIIDLSYAAARQLDMIRAGVVPIRLQILSVGP